MLITREREQAELREILSEIESLLSQRKTLQRFITTILQKAGLTQSLHSLLDSLPTPPKQGWERVKLKQAAFYPQDRIEITLLTSQNYVGVDNLLQDKKGKREAGFVLDGTGTTNAYNKNDILIGNIRPYLKKNWFANVNGGTNNDVVVVRSKETQIKPKFLYYILSDDDFFEYEMQNVKGVKMPRGDKDSIKLHFFSSAP